MVLSITDDLRHLSGLVDKFADAVVVPESGSPRAATMSSVPWTDSWSAGPASGFGRRPPVHRDQRGDAIRWATAMLISIAFRAWPWASNAYPS